MTFLIPSIVFYIIGVIIYLIVTGLTYTYIMKGKTIGLRGIDPNIGADRTVASVLSAVWPCFWGFNIFLLFMIEFPQLCAKPFLKKPKSSEYQPFNKSNVSSDGISSSVCGPASGNVPYLMFPNDGSQREREAEEVCVKWQIPPKIVKKNISIKAIMFESPGVETILIDYGGYVGAVNYWSLRQKLLLQKSELTDEQLNEVKEAAIDLLTELNHRTSKGQGNTIYSVVEKPLTGLSHKEIGEDGKVKILKNYMDGLKISKDGDTI